MNSLDSTIKRLENQIDWYEHRSKNNQRWFRCTKIIEIGAAAFIPLLAGLKVSSIIVGVFGIIVVVLEGLQQLYQFHHNWIVFRSTCEDLKHEKYLHEAKAGPYATAANPNVLLAERMEGLISQEHAKWVSAQQEAARMKKQGGTNVS